MFSVYLGHELIPVNNYSSGFWLASLIIFSIYAISAFFLIKFLFTPERGNKIRLNANLGSWLILAVIAQVILLKSKLDLLPLILFCIAGYLLYKKTTIISYKELKIESGVSFLLLAMAFAGLLRFSYLGHYFPKGLEQDEAIWINQYLLALKGDLSFFRSGIFGIPILHGPPHIIALFLFGTSEFSARLYSAILAVFSLVPAFILIRDIFGIKTAKLFSILLILSPWHIFYSRMLGGSRYIFVALMLAVFCRRTYLTNGKTAILYSFIAGLYLALSQYDYFATKSVLLVFLVSLLLYGKRLNIKTQLLPGVTSCMVLLTPLVADYYEVPSRLFGRIAEQESLSFFYNSSLIQVWDNLSNTLLMFNRLSETGRRFWFSNPYLIYFSPYFASIITPFIVALCLIVLKAKLKSRITLVVTALFCFVLPTLISSEPPDSHRAVLAIIPSLVVLALALESLNIPNVLVLTSVLATYQLVSRLWIPNLTLDYHYNEFKYLEKIGYVSSSQKIANLDLYYDTNYSHQAEFKYPNLTQKVFNPNGALFKTNSVTIIKNWTKQRFMQFTQINPKPNCNIVKFNEPFNTNQEEILICLIKDKLKSKFVWNQTLICKDGTKRNEIKAFIDLNYGKTLSIDNPICNPPRYAFWKTKLKNLKGRLIRFSLYGKNGDFEIYEGKNEKLIFRQDINNISSRPVKLRLSKRNQTIKVLWKPYNIDLDLIAGLRLRKTKFTSL